MKRKAALLKRIKFRDGTYIAVFDPHLAKALELAITTLWNLDAHYVDEMNLRKPPYAEMALTARMALKEISEELKALADRKFLISGELARNAIVEWPDVGELQPGIDPTSNRSMLDAVDTVKGKVKTKSIRDIAVKPPGGKRVSIAKMRRR